MTLDEKLKKLAEVIEGRAGKRSDDFGHSVQALLEYESEALQETTNDAENLLAALQRCREQRNDWANSLERVSIKSGWDSEYDADPVVQKDDAEILALLEKSTKEGL